MSDMREVTPQDYAIVEDPEGAIAYVVERSDKAMNLMSEKQEFSGSIDQVVEVETGEINFDYDSSLLIVDDGVKKELIPREKVFRTGKIRGENDE